MGTYRPIKKPLNKQNELFRGDPTQPHLNACVGLNGGPYDFSDYASGYMRAGISLANEATTQGFRNPVDIMIYPIAYCFRHAIELYLKHLSLALPKLWREEGTIKSTHKLLDNWNQVKTLLKREKAFLDEPELLSKAGTIIQNYVEIDPKGEAFRFPEDLSGNTSLEQTYLINVRVLSEAMSELGEIFENWSNLAEVLLDHKLQYEWSDS